MNQEEPGSEQWLAQVFARRVQAELFTDHAPGRDRPLLVLLGGQPAAGKTRAQQAIQAEHPDDDLVEITGDDLREYHPDYRRLADGAPFLMPGATAPVSGGLVRLALDHAWEHRYSVLLEGTFRDPDMCAPPESMESSSAPGPPRTARLIGSARAPPETSCAMVVRATLSHDVRQGKGTFSASSRSNDQDTLM